MLNKTDSIEEMAATIAHEIKNPLSLVQANINLLELADKEKTYSKNYNVIKNELNKINDMMVDFLELTKESTEDTDIVYVFDILNSIISKYKISLENEIEIIFNYGKEVDDYIVLANSQRLTRVFDNLIKNSVEATSGNDHRSIKINLYIVEKSVVVEIKDNGTGINNMDLENIEKPFYTTKTTGSGLGLSITKKIIKELNGRFTLKNNVNDNGAIARVEILRFFN